MIVVASALLGTVLGGVAAWPYFSGSATYQTNSFTAGSLAPPTNFKAIMTGTTSASLTWSAPPALTGYTLSQSPGTMAGTCVPTLSASTNFCTGGSLTPGTNYTWALTAVYDDWASASVTTPAMAIVYPANGTTYGVNWSGAITGTASTIAPAMVSTVVVTVQQGSGNYFNGSGFTSPTPVGILASGTTSWTLSLPGAALTSGDSYTVITQATDSAGDTGPSAATFTYNTSAPTVSFGFPANTGDYNAAAWTSAAPIAGTLSGTASTINPSSVSLTITQSSTGQTWNGASFASGAHTVTPSYNQSTGAFSYGFASAGFPAEGTYVMLLNVTDEAGNSGNASVGFTYDNVTPTALAPVVGATTTFGSGPLWVDEEPLNLTDLPTDAGGSGVASVAYYYCAGASGSCTSTNGTFIASSSSSSQNFPVRWATPLPADGTYRLVAVATGYNSIVSGASASTLVGVDTAGPVVAAPTVAAAVTHGTNPVFVSNETVGLSDISVADAGSGANSVAYYYCAGGSGSCNSSNWSEIGSPSTNFANNYPVTWSTPLPTDGPYQIVAVATDEVGNAATSASVSLSVDKTPPTVSTPIVNGFS